jgi:hypothetical protein
MVASGYLFCSLFSNKVNSIGIQGRRNCDFSVNPGPNSCLDGGCNGGLVRELAFFLKNFTSHEKCIGVRSNHRNGNLSFFRSRHPVDAYGAMRRVFPPHPWQNLTSVPAALISTTASLSFLVTLCDAAILRKILVSLVDGYNLPCVPYLVLHPFPILILVFLFQCPHRQHRRLSHPQVCRGSWTKL